MAIPSRGAQGAGGPSPPPRHGPGQWHRWSRCHIPVCWGLQGCRRSTTGGSVPSCAHCAPPTRRHGCPLSPKRAPGPFSSAHPSGPCPECSPLPMGTPHRWPQYHTMQWGAADRAPPGAALHPAMTRGQHRAGQGCSWRKRRRQGVLRVPLLRGPPPRAQQGQWGGTEGLGQRAAGRGDAGCRGTAGPGGGSLAAPLLGGVLADEGVPLAAGVVLPRHETCERREQSERWGGERGCAGRALLREGGSRSSLGPAVPRAGTIPPSPPRDPQRPRSPEEPSSTVQYFPLGNSSSSQAE